jgi:hypothetical protein
MAGSQVNALRDQYGFQSADDCCELLETFCGVYIDEECERVSRWVPPPTPGPGAALVFTRMRMPPAGGWHSWRHGRPPAAGGWT